MKVLLLDLGNASLHLAVYNNGVKETSLRVYADKLKSSMEYQELFAQFLLYHHLEPHSFDGAILCSVVPSLTKRIQNAASNLINKPCLLVNKTLKTGLAVRIDNPNELGSDLLAMGVGAIKDYKEDVFIADLSSCASFLVVSKSKGYLGGALFPGLRSSADNLINSSAQLLDIEYEKPKRLIGRSTKESLNSGIVGGYALLIKGMAEKMEEEYGSPLKKILTGDDASIIKDSLNEEFTFNPDLVFDGLDDIYTRNSINKKKEGK